jgi:hypothetical protein
MKSCVNGKGNGKRVQSNKAKYKMEIAGNFELAIRDGKT